MMKPSFYIIAICLLMGVSLCGHSPIQAQELQVVPMVNEVEYLDGTFVLPATVTISAPAVLRNEAGLLEGYLKRDFQVKQINKATVGATVILRLDPALRFSKGKNGYALQVSDKIEISSNTSEGVFYGIQTLRQLLVSNNGRMSVQRLKIKDAPSFSWRAFMLDEARAFKGTEVVKYLLDEMARLKLNVFHWHLTDDQGWRMEIKKYPLLTQVGSVRDSTQVGGYKGTTYDGVSHSGFYTQDEVKNIIAYAKERHITIIPEIEMPGHASAAIAAYPWLGASKKQIKVPGRFGVQYELLDVASDSVHQFISDVFDEVIALFPAPIVHIGGDEVKYNQWKESDAIQRYMKKNAVHTPADLQIRFTNKISHLLQSKGRRMMGWNDITGNRIHEYQSSDDTQVREKLTKGTVVQFWKGDIDLIRQTALEGYDIVNSYHYMTYLDYDYNKISLEKAYLFSPIPDGLDASLQKYVIGLGCQMWGEEIMSTQRMYDLIFPRIAAYAESGWTKAERKDYDRFTRSIRHLEKYWRNLKEVPATGTEYAISSKVDALLGRMTLEEKIAEMTQSAPANKRLGIPTMVYSECLHGLWLKGATVFPQAIALGSTWEPELLRQMNTHVAKEARSINVSHCYSPNLDVITGDPRYGRVEESYGEDPYLVTQMGVAFIEGLQGVGSERFDKNHILATAKHFVAYPENRTGLNGAFTDISTRRLYEIHLPAFEAAVKVAKVGSLMPAHQDLNGIPCHMNTWLLNDLLRKEWKFDGFVVSDNNDLGRLQTMHKIAETRQQAALLGLNAGVDMDLVIGKSLSKYSYHYEILKDTLARNPQLVPLVDRSVRRILTTKYQLGLFDQSSVASSDSIQGTKEAQELAYKIAQKAVILLKNENQLLPLDKKQLKSIAIIGPNAKEVVLPNGKYTQMGSYSGIPPYYVSLYDGIRSKVGTDVLINYAEGCKINTQSKAGFAEAIAAAKKSDVVILAIGGSTETCEEGIDRDNLELTGVQNELVEAIHKTGKPVVVVLINGRPLTINYIAEKTPAIIESWYLGMRSGDALADVIFGDYNPGGKLTVTFPRNVGQLPMSYLAKPDCECSGRGKYLQSDKSPLFPFGFGLSYTTFSYSDVKLSADRIKKDQSTNLYVNVTNTGKFDGDEVAQLYIKDEFASVGRYVKALKGFKRIHLKAGETKQVHFSITPEELSLYDAAMRKVVEPGDFTVSVGASSMDKDLLDINLRVIE